jgi:hypothetical protein
MTATRLGYDIAGAPEQLGLFLDGDNVLWINPAADYHLVDGALITVTASDNDGASVEATFTVYVTPVNDAPVAGQISDLTVDEDSGQSLVVDLDEVFSDVDGDALGYDIAGAPEQLGLFLDGGQLSCGSTTARRLPSGGGTAARDHGYGLR